MDYDDDVDMSHPPRRPSPSYDEPDYVPPGGLPYEGQQERPALLQLRELEATRDSGRRRGRDRLDEALEPEPEEMITGAGAELAGRLSRHRVYLLEESGAVVHKGAHRGEMKDDVDLSFLEAASSTSSAPIRDNALYLSGGAVAHLPTAKIFSYVTRYAPAPLGVEWINDTSLVVLFRSAHEAYHALTCLVVDRFAPGPPTNDDPLESRAARAVPASLLPPSDPDAMDDLDDTEADAGPNSLRVRYAKTDDMKSRAQASSSRFYQRYGRHAGKEVAPPVLDEVDDLEPVAREDAVELLGGDAEQERGAGFRADTTNGSGRQELLSSASRNRSRSPRPAKRAAMDLLDDEEEAQRSRPPLERSLLDRLKRPRDRRERSPDQKGGMRGWEDDGVATGSGRSLIDRLDNDDAIPDRSWRDEPRVPVLEERVGEYAERRYDERRERRSRNGNGARQPRAPREAPKKKTAEDLDRELSEYLGR